MSMLLKDHARVLGVNSKTISRLRSINIETLEDLADSSIDKIRRKLECTSERAQVLINRARRAVAGRSPSGHRHPSVSPADVAASE